MLSFEKIKSYPCIFNCMERSAVSVLNAHIVPTVAVHNRVCVKVKNRTGRRQDGTKVILSRGIDKFQHLRFQYRVSFVLTKPCFLLFYVREINI